MIGKLPLLAIALGAAGAGAAAGAIVVTSVAGAPAAAIVSVAPAATSAPLATAATTDSATPSADSSTPAADPTLPVDSGHPGQISSTFVINTIQTQLAAQEPAGTTVQVTCPRTGLFPSVSGDTFTCSFDAATPSGDRTGQVEVNVTSTQNNWTWSVV